MSKIRRLLLLALICTSVRAAGDAPPTGSGNALDTPVTLAVKGEALSDIAGMLNKQTGVHVRVTKDVADEKATVFVDQKPLGEILSGLELISGGRWRWSVVKDGGSSVYELWEPVSSKSIRQRATVGASIDVDSILDSVIAASSRDHSEMLTRRAELILQLDLRWSGIGSD